MNNPLKDLISELTMYSALSDDEQSKLAFAKAIQSAHIYAKHWEKTMKIAYLDGRLATMIALADDVECPTAEVYIAYKLNSKK